MTLGQSLKAFSPIERRISPYYHIRSKKILTVRSPVRTEYGVLHGRRGWGPLTATTVTPRRTKRWSTVRDNEDDDVCSDAMVANEELEVLKRKLEMFEQIEEAVRTIEARVNALDDKLWSICDEEMEQEAQIQEILLNNSTSASSEPRYGVGTGKQKRTMQKTAEHAWDTYRASFTIVLTKGYLQTVEQLRERIMVQEWDQNLANVARMNGVARFEAFCAISKSPHIEYSEIARLYETHGRDLDVIRDPHLRMRARSLIKQEEFKMKTQCYERVTEESRRLAKQFSEAEFLHKVLPDPIEHGLVSSVETLMGMFMSSHK
jgi:hypothetical protein